MVKRIQTLPKKTPKSPEPLKMESDDSDDDDDDDDDDEEKPAVKNVPKSPVLVETNPENSGDTGTEDTLRVMGFSIDKYLEVVKNEEEPVFKKMIYRGQKISYVLNLIPTTLKKC